jgi:arylformamidase
VEIFDISTTIDPETVTWEDESTPEILWQRRISDGDHVNLSFLKISTHTATHLDAPYHFIQGGKKLHQLDLALFLGECRVVETTVGTITAPVLQDLDIPKTERILLKTGSSSLYKKKGFSRGFSALDESGARWMVENRVKLVGIEYLSIEHHGNHTQGVHHILLSQGIAILEGLNLENIRSGPYRLIVLPLKLKGTEGAPARAILTPL